jgi:hypothetical protein
VILLVTLLVVATGCVSGGGRPLTTIAGCMPSRPNDMMQEFIRNSSATIIIENVDEHNYFYAVGEIFRDSVRTYFVLDGSLSKPITHVVSIDGDFVYPSSSSDSVLPGFEKYVFPLGVTYLISYKGAVANGGYVTHHCIYQIEKIS